MYNIFFGFKESPFQLVPNPAYLFLSKSHEEALAHLVYAISHGDGFVMISGEVGTGKTTICRAFLETLDQKTEAAFIFNPKLDAIQLLKAINDEFGISSEADNTKDLIDRLNSFLMEKKTQGKRVLLIIDEAQNLTNEVLEQLRLLSNLETNTRKLLQIVLVGQPELGKMLDAYELRQLRQRITLSCHLTPLTFRETKKYILYRIHNASRRSGVNFTQAAFREIYRYSRGIPRMINIVCDRALLTAFGYNQLRINRSIVKGSVQELVGGIGAKAYFIQQWKSPVFILTVVSFFVLVGTFLIPVDLDKKNFKKNLLHPESKTSQTGRLEIIPPETIAKAVDKSETDHAGNGQVMSQVNQPDEKPHAYLGDILMTLDPDSSRRAAFIAALELWGQENDIAGDDNFDIEDSRSFFRMAAGENGFLVRRFEGNLRLLRNINLPAILEFDYSSKSRPVYLTLSQMNDKKIVLTGGKYLQQIEVTPADLELFWAGVAFVPWKNYLGISGTVPVTASADSIVALKAFLIDIGFSDIDLDPSYDERTEEVIKEIQRKYGIQVDGVVGPTTKIVLNNENKLLTLPRILMGQN